MSAFFWHLVVQAGSREERAAARRERRAQRKRQQSGRDVSASAAPPAAEPAPPPPEPVAPKPPPASPSSSSPSSSQRQRTMRKPNTGPPKPSYTPASSSNSSSNNNGGGFNFAAVGSTVLGGIGAVFGFQQLKKVQTAADPTYYAAGGAGMIGVGRALPEYHIGWSWVGLAQGPCEPVTVHVRQGRSPGALCEGESSQAASRSVLLLLEPLLLGGASTGAP